MGWRDAPLVGSAPPARGGSSWRDAPMARPTAPAPAPGPRYSFAEESPFGFSLEEGETDPRYEGTTGALKGAGNTAIGLGKITRRLGSAVTLGAIDPKTEEFNTARTEVAPTNEDQKRGMNLEQAAEFFAVPGPQKLVGAGRALRFGARALTQGLPNAVLAGAQSDSKGTALATGALSMVPIGEALAKGGRWFSETVGPAFVRSHIKPTVAAMRHIAGASTEGLEAKAADLVNFILENKLATSKQASAVLNEAERGIQRVLSLKNAPTTAPLRAQAYVEEFKRAAGKQLMPAEDVAIIEGKLNELLRGPMGEDVVSTVMAPSKVLGPNGAPIMVPTDVTKRQFRATMPADEALAHARGSSRFRTSKEWGEMGSTAVEASKRAESGTRDAVKDAIPELAPLLKREGHAIDARDALDRSEFRIGNRDQGGLPAQVVAGREMIGGKIPIIGYAFNLLRDHQAELGVGAYQLGKAIQSGDAPQVAWVLYRLGITVPPIMLRPAVAAPAR